MNATALMLLTRAVWEAIDGGMVRGACVTVRELYAGIAAELMLKPGYDPETDVRVRFLREVLRCIREQVKFSTVDAELKFAAGYAVGCMATAAPHWTDQAWDENDRKLEQVVAAVKMLKGSGPVTAH